MRPQRLPQENTGTLMTAGDDLAAATGGLLPAVVQAERAQGEAPHIDTPRKYVSCLPSCLACPPSHRLLPGILPSLFVMVMRA